MRLAQFLLTLLLGTTSVSGLYEDQIDTFDWRRDLIGAPRHVHFVAGFLDNNSNGTYRQKLFIIELATTFVNMSHLKTE